MVSPSEVRKRAQADPSFRDRLILYIEGLAEETMPVAFELNVPVVYGEATKGQRVFMSIPDPWQSDFDEHQQQDVFDIVPARQMHNPSHLPTCFKKAWSKKCRFNFPRKLIDHTGFDMETGIVQDPAVAEYVKGTVYVKRDNRWLNPYNRWLTIVTRANHDVRFLFTAAYALAAIHYVMKYMSKAELSNFVKLMIASALCAANTDSMDRTTILMKMLNKLDAETEIGEPQLYSLVTDSPDHFTNCHFQSVNTNRLLSQVKHDPTILADSRIIATPNGLSTVSIFDDYRFRGECFESLCLYDYCQLVTKKANRTGEPFDADHPLNDRFTPHVRTELCMIPNLIGRLVYLLKESRSREEQDDYFCLLSIIFVPWRHVGDIKPVSESWEDYFKEQYVRIDPQIRWYITNLDHLRKTKTGLQLNRKLMEASQNNNRDEDLSDEGSHYGYEHDNEFDIDFKDATNRLTYCELATLLSNEPVLDDLTQQAMDAARATGYLSDDGKDLISVLGETHDDHKITHDKVLNTNRDEEDIGIFVTVDDTAKGLREKLPRHTV